MKHLTIGLTGSICAGKSKVSSFIKEMGIPVIDADVIAREVVVPGSKGLNHIINVFGDKYLQNDGCLNRKMLGELISSCKEMQLILNKILHPIIKEESNKQIAAAHNDEHNIVIYDSALIIETKQLNQFRPLIVVWAPIETQIARLIKRNNISEETARIWIGMQLSSDEKASYADYIIKTTGTLEELKQQTINTIKEIKYNDLC